MASRYRWFTPFWGYAGGVSLAASNSLTIGLLGPEDDLTDPLEEKAYRVTRIVGQWQIRFTQIVLEGGQSQADAYYLTNRVYPVSSDGGTVYSRDLQNITDADTDWMWNQIDAWGTDELAGAGGRSLGNWGIPGPGSTSGSHRVQPFMSGRNGHFDIKVDRRIDEGEELVWKAQLNVYRLNGASIWQEQNFTSGDFTIGLWMRMLVKEAY